MSGNLSNPKPGYTVGKAARSGARRGGRPRRGEAGRGEAGRVGAGRDGAGRGGAMRPENNPPLRFPRNRKTNVLVIFRKHEHKIKCKPNRGTQRAVDRRFISGTAAALRPWLLTCGLLHVYVQAKTLTYHGRVGTGRRTAGWRGGAGAGNGTPTDRFVQETTVPRTPRRSKTTLLGESLEARTKGTLWKPRVLSPHRFTWDFVCSCFRKIIQDSCLPFSEGNRNGCLLGEPTCRRPVQPRTAGLRPFAVRRPVWSSPWYVRVLDSAGHARHIREPSWGKSDWVFAGYHSHRSATDFSARTLAPHCCRACPGGVLP